MGWMLRAAEVVDLVVVFQGAKVPFALCRCKDWDRHFLLGECCKFKTQHCDRSWTNGANVGM